MAIIQGSMNHTTSGRKKKSYGKSRSYKGKYIEEAYSKPVPYRRDEGQVFKSADSFGSPEATAKPDRQTYTGTFVVGLATMHKSNIVPVTQDTDASDYATMRRN